MSTLPFGYSQHDDSELVNLRKQNQELKKIIENLNMIIKTMSMENSDLKDIISSTASTYN